MITLDFETHPIVPGAPKAPEPVGLAVRGPRGGLKYYAWGHPCENNSSFEEARSVLKKAQAQPVLFHNAQFDLRVARDWFGVTFDLENVHDTKILAFIHSPNHRTLSLKPLSEEWLGMPPDEQDEMHDWLRQNFIPARRTKNPTKYTAYAPGALAGRYAMGDVERTHRLYRYLQPQLDEAEQSAYRREVDILYKVIGMESGGIRVDMERLDRDLKKVTSMAARAQIAAGLKLGTHSINFNSRQQLADALLSKNLLSHVKETAKGSIAVGIPALRETCVDQELVDDLELLSKINKLSGTYMRPWLESAEANDGYFYPYINPTRVDGESGGTRTGRFSSNFQQVPKARYGDLPYMRDYVLPDRGHVLVDRDYSQQELRIFAHYAEGTLADAYVKDPDLDMHDTVRDIIRDVTNTLLDRKVVKVCNFLTLYGGGVARLADQLDIPENEASDIKAAHRKALPELRALQNDIADIYKRRFDQEGAGYIRTWGGRKYSVDEGFEYKLLNALIQGSAADQTKEAIRRLEFTNGNCRLMLQVHDELLVSAPARSANKASEQLRVAMEFEEGWDIPMRTDVTISERWGE